MLAANGVPKARGAAVIAAYKGRRGEPVHEGQRVKLLFADFDGSGKEMQLARVSVYNDEELDSMVAVTDRGNFMQVPTAPTTVVKKNSPRTRVAPVEDGENDDSEDWGE